MLSVDAGDTLTFGAQVLALNMKNNTYLTGRNQADSANIDLIKVDGGDQIALGAIVANLAMNTNTYITSNSVNIAKVDSTSRVDIADSSILLKGTDTLADNTSATTLTNMPAAGTGNAFFIYYKIVRGALYQYGQLVIDEDNSGLIEECYGDDAGVTFTEAAGALQYATTSTGTACTMTYTIIKL